MKKPHEAQRRPFVVVPYGWAGKKAHIDPDDLAELCHLGLPPETWYLAQGTITTVLPNGKPIAIARLITEAPPGMRVRHLSRDPGELRRFALHLRPSKRAKQCGKVAKVECRELAAINQRMRARTYVSTIGTEITR
ncbi:hypothetical protein [Stenotrophomonas nematodicola]|uniref:hypothetical protein n=1 Tax=Stenotrophomonas nematodicola TaxID=2656746 RepID=UPI003D9A50D7